MQNRLRLLCLDKSQLQVPNKLFAKVFKLDLLCSWDPVWTPARQRMVAMLHRPFRPVVDVACSSLTGCRKQTSTRRGVFSAAGQRGNRSDRLQSVLLSAHPFHCKGSVGTVFFLALFGAGLDQKLVCLNIQVCFKDSRVVL